MSCYLSPPSRCLCEHAKGSSTHATAPDSCGTTVRGTAIPRTATRPRQFVFAPPACRVSAPTHASPASGSRRSLFSARWHALLVMALGDLVGGDRRGQRLSAALRLYVQQQYPDSASGIRGARALAVALCDLRLSNLGLALDTTAMQTCWLAAMAGQRADYCPSDSGSPSSCVVVTEPPGAWTAMHSFSYSYCTHYTRRAVYTV